MSALAVFRPFAVRGALVAATCVSLALACSGTGDGDDTSDQGSGGGAAYGGSTAGSGGKKSTGGTQGSGGDSPQLGGNGGGGASGLGGAMATGGGPGSGGTPGTGGMGTGGTTTEPDVDPWDCVVGQDDGCCPLTISRGGTDPDCPDLSCSLELAPDVVTFDDWRSSSQGVSGVGLAWTGEYLAVARLLENEETGIGGSGNYSYDVVLEKRDATGQEIATKKTFAETGQVPLARGPGALAYHQKSDTFLFTYHTYPNSRGVAFDASAQKLWSTQAVSQCSGVNATHMVRTTPSGFVTGYRNAPCSGGATHTGVVDFYDLVGNRTHIDLVADYTSVVDYGCNRDCSSILAYAHSGDPFGYLWESGATPPITKVKNTKTTTSIYNGPNTTGVAFDGEKYLVIGNEENGYENDTIYINFFDPSTKTFSAATDSMLIKRTGWPMSVIWTGSGFVAAIPTPNTSSTSVLPARTTSEILILQIDAGGKITRNFWLEAHKGVLPQLSLVGDRIAISWVRSDTTIESRHLGFLECAVRP